VWCDAIVGVTWLIHMCDAIHLCIYEYIPGSDIGEGDVTQL